MIKNYTIWGLVLLLGLGGVGSAMGQEPDPAEAKLKDANAKKYTNYIRPVRDGR